MRQPGLDDFSLVSKKVLAQCILINKLIFINGVNICSNTLWHLANNFLFFSYLTTKQTCKEANHLFFILLSRLIFVI